VLEERGLELLLVNARHVKLLPGRKTDACDAAWLCELLEHGLLRGSFVPPPAIRELPDPTRYRKRLIQAHTAECQHIHKTLEDASIRLGSVAADVLGDRPAVLAWQVGQQPEHQRLGPPLWLHPAKPTRDPAQQLLQPCLPSGRVYAVACGHHLIIGCPHNTRSSTVAALACSPALTGPHFDRQSIRIRPAAS